MTLSTAQFTVQQVTDMMNQYVRLKGELRTKVYDDGLITLQKAQFVRSEGDVDMEQIQIIEDAMAEVMEKKNQLAQLKLNIDEGIEQLQPQFEAKTIPLPDALYFASALMQFFEALV